MVEDRRGLLDKSNWVWDANISQTGLNLFKKWFAERKLFSPHASIWSFDREKLVIPSVFMDYDFLETVVKSYDQATKVVRREKDELGKTRTLLAITSFSKEIFKKAYFNSRAVEIDSTLCKFFGG